MWSGFGRAVHYLDHFSLLSTELTDGKGLMTSNYSFNVDRDWALSFKLKKDGSLRSDKDGFMLNLSPHRLNLMDENDRNRNTLDFVKIAVV